MKKKKIKWDNVLKIIDLLLFIYCSTLIIHDIKMLIQGWTLTWFGVFMLIVSVILLDLLFEEYKKVLKVTVSKALRVLGVNNIFTTKLYQKNAKNAKEGF